VAGDWWLVTGGWWLVAGGWWLVAGDCSRIIGGTIMCTTQPKNRGLEDLVW